MPFLGQSREGDHERVLRQLLGEPDIARHLGEPGDQRGGFDAPDGFDGAIGGKFGLSWSMGGGVDQIRLAAASRCAYCCCAPCCSIRS